MRSVAVLVVVVLAGCSGKPAGPPTAAVRGTVTLDGKPLREGEIQFWTVSQGRYEILPIAQGAFSGTVAVGERRVQIYSFKAGPALTGPGEGNPGPPINTLPERYSTASELQATVLEADANEFAFPLQSK